MTQVSAAKIKNQVRITDLLSRLSLEPSRAGFIRCPAHADNTPSLKIYPESDSFYCFSCTAGGSVIDFYMLYADVDFSTAAEKLASMFGVDKEMTRADRVSAWQSSKKQRKKNKKQSEYEFWLKKWQKHKNVLDEDHDGWNPRLEEACMEIAYAQYRMEVADEDCRSC